MSPWVCQSLRLSVLWPTPDESQTKALTWERVTGLSPEQHESQPRFGTNRDLGSIWEGTTILELRTSPGRVDWTASPAIPPDVQLSTFPNLGEMTETVTR